MVKNDIIFLAELAAWDKIILVLKYVHVCAMNKYIIILMLFL